MKDGQFHQWWQGYRGQIRLEMPPSWRGSKPGYVTFVFTEHTPSRQLYRDFYALCVRGHVPNPRLITRETLEYASLFHPLFFRAVTRMADDNTPFGKWLQSVQAYTGLLQCENVCVMGTPHFWLQSTLFLAGVTLSAAIVQSRWSEGTVVSKLDHLWRAGIVAENNGMEALHALDLCGKVRQFAQALPECDESLIMKIKHTYSQALAAVAEGFACRYVPLEAQPLSPELQQRFGFVDMLKDKLGGNLQCVIVYGSSVQSSQYDDYDLILVVKDEEDALRRFTATSPCYNGRDLNMSIFSEEHFRIYQSMSGDNLPDHGICVYGKTMVPIKEAGDLMMRNYSFGFVRLRQLLGMAAYAASQRIEADDDDKTNLFNYFIKISLNVVRGIRGVTGESLKKEDVIEWMAHTLGYDIAEQKILCRESSDYALADAAWATQAVLDWYTTNRPILQRVPVTAPYGKFTPDALALMD